MENQQEELIKPCTCTLPRELARAGSSGPCKVNQKELTYPYLARTADKQDLAKRHEEPINK
jgi:hypothetical protein